MTDNFTIDEVVSLCKDKTPGIGKDIVGVISSAEREDAARVLKYSCYEMPEVDRVQIRDVCTAIFLPFTDGTSSHNDEYFYYLVDNVIYFADEGTVDVLATAFDWFCEEIQYWIAQSLRDVLYEKLDQANHPYTRYRPLADKVFGCLKDNTHSEFIGLSYEVMAVVDPRPAFTLIARVLKRSALERDQSTFSVVYDPFLMAMTLSGPEFVDRAKHILKQKDVALMHEACFPENDYVKSL